MSNPIAMVLIVGMVSVLYLALVGVGVVREWWRQR